MPSEQRQEVQQTQSQNSVTNPWAPTRGILTDILSRFSTLGSNAANDNGASPNQSAALGNLQNTVASLPNLGPDALNAIKGLFGSNTSGAVNMLNTGYADLLKNIGATARGDELDPYKTPGFGDSVTRMTNDITDKVKSVYAAAGRDPSGAGSFAGSLGKGLTEGIAPVIQSQFNTNNANRFAAAKNLFDASTGTANAITAQNQVPLENALKGITASGALPGLYMQPGAAQYDIATKAADLPWTNMSRWLQGVLPIAALGSESSGTGTTNRTTTQPDSLMGNILGGISGLTGILGQTGAFAGAQGAGWLSSLLPALALSDARAKENIAEIGETHDGQPLYSFNYKGDRTPHVGLMAQDVEKRDPGAVIDVDGWKVVDYGRALAASRGIGMASKLLEAA